MCSNLQKFDLRWSRWTVKHESVFEVALVSFVYKRMVWNPCSRDNPFGKEDYVDIKPWVTCISILVLVDFCSKVNAFSLSFPLTVCKNWITVLWFLLFVLFTLFFSYLPLTSPFELSHKHSNLISIFPWLKKDCPHIWGGFLFKHGIFIRCALMIKMQ